ncbi:patatin-like phospholipase family protein [Vibrio sp. ZSDE26]|uniref:Patatin-like phospholipase family protein n=1 Tax=Vibrio amylolyticus TaxID=2847292 RepID=A0A9X2BJH8_9VIBR|nr:patatin-like phospholipase family protein [Vibrio amylolyticus]MCK6263482.1 patatin-like phospholipase family protein [Vibrio amylolyticus]
MNHRIFKTTRRTLRQCYVLILLTLTSACSTTPERNASINSESMNPLNVSGLRFWDDHISKTENYDVLAEIDALIKNKADTDMVNHLALSGGGVNGAFSAGILNAWTEQGTRPDFDVVTGVSTGALVSVFAFLGSEYDEQLKHYYTETTLDEMFKRNSIIQLISRRAIVDTTGFEEKVRNAINTDMIEKIAVEREKGRLLLIATTNLDNEKMAVWDVGRIAELRSAEAQKLVQDIVIASSSIPGAFPAKIINLDSDVGNYDELHVDGGVSRQVFLIPQWMQNRTEVSPFKQTVYVIRNGSLKPRFSEVDNSISSVSARSVSTLTRRQGVGDVEYIYHYSLSHDLDFNLAHIDDDFIDDDLDPLGLEYMNAVFDYGYWHMKSETLWLERPPSLGKEFKL